MSLQSRALMVHNLDGQCELVVHPVLSTDTGLTLGAGRCLSTDDYDSLVAAFTNQRPQKAELLPPEVLGFDDSNVYWWRSAGEALIGTQEGEKKVHLPALVFHIGPKGIRVAALKKNERPNAQTRLYHSGLPNVWSSTLWCAGGNRTPDQPRWQAISRYQAVLLESPFTHASTSELKGVSDTYEFWCDSRRTRPFPLSRLLATGLTLGEWMEGKAGE